MEELDLAINSLKERVAALENKDTSTEIAQVRDTLTNATRLYHEVRLIHGKMSRLLVDAQHAKATVIDAHNEFNRVVTWWADYFRARPTLNLRNDLEPAISNMAEDIEATKIEDEDDEYED